MKLKFFQNIVIFLIILLIIPLHADLLPPLENFKIILSWSTFGSELEAVLIIPDPESLLDLEPEELAGVVLEHLNSIPPSEVRSLLHANNICVEYGIREYPQDYHDRISQALMEAWVWLEREGLIAPRPGEQTHGWVFITRRGQRLKQATDLAAFQKANLLPKTLLHPVVAQNGMVSILKRRI